MSVVPFSGFGPTDDDKSDEESRGNSPGHKKHSLEKVAKGKIGVAYDLGHEKYKLDRTESISVCIQRQIEHVESVLKYFERTRKIQVEIFTIGKSSMSYSEGFSKTNSSTWECGSITGRFNHYDKDKPDEQQGYKKKGYHAMVVLQAIDSRSIPYDLASIGLTPEDFTLILERGMQRYVETHANFTFFGRHRGGTGGGGGQVQDISRFSGHCLYVAIKMKSENITTEKKEEKIILPPIDTPTKQAEFNINMDLVNLNIEKKV